MTTGTVLRPIGPGDYEHVIVRLDDWWGGRAVAPMLPRLFFGRAAALGCSSITCVTSAANAGSRAFHAAMGFGERRVDDDDGRGEARMVLRRAVAPAHSSQAAGR